jgi:hypothetical protein
MGLRLWRHIKQEAAKERVMLLSQSIQAPITMISFTCKLENFIEANKAYLGSSLIMSKDNL